MSELSANMEEEYLDDPKKYFSDDEWNKLGRYEKIRIVNSYEIYVEMYKSGFKLCKPDYMTRKIEAPKRKNTETSEQRPSTSKVATKQDKQDAEQSKQPRSSRRNVPKRNYREADLIESDRYIYCDLCMNEYLDKCDIHESIFLSDNPVPLTPENPDRARDTVPKGWLRVCSSKILNAGEGVWALKTIKLGTRFGPYEGTIEEKECDHHYSWQLKTDGKVSYINAQNPSNSNWMRYVNCSRVKSEQNLMPYQYRGEMYYRAVADISPGVELLVYYGPQFARELGIDTKNYSSASDLLLNDNIFSCSTCELVFSSPVYLENHSSRCRYRNGNKIEKRRKILVDRSTNVNNNNESYKCYMCDKIYTLKKFYEYHLMVKHCVYQSNKQANKSVDKSAAAATNTDLNRTDDVNEQQQQLQQQQHVNNARRFKCNVCEKAFPSRSLLERHTRTHTGERPYQCNTCHKTFTLAANLKDHKLIHTGDKPHECDVCGRTFNHTSNLTAHKRSHDNVRPYQCAVCSHTFTQSCNLTKHMFKHTGQRPYHCDLCTYTCAYATNLKRHIRTHTGEKPYICQHCDKAFTQSSSLTAHIRTQHKEHTTH